jgi:hypothetical protein
MADRRNKFLLKRSNVAGKIPTDGDLLLGEMALNTADVILYASGTTANSILPIGWDRVSITGDTINGDIIINGDLTVTGNTNFANISATTIDPVDYIQFNTTVTGITEAEGKIYWDSPNGTLSLGMEGGDVSLQIGQEQYYYIKNQSGSTIQNGRVVRAAGTLGASGRILGEYMIADGTIPPKFTLGIATEDILNGDDGYVTEFGLVRGIDTTGTLYGETWNDGDVLWVSPTIAGGLTNVEPIAPDLHIEMAIVILSDANGSVFVRPTRYPHFYDLQEAGWSAGTENNLDIIQWNTSLGYFQLTNTPTLNSLSANTISATTFYGDGSNLTGLSSGETNNGFNVGGAAGEIFRDKTGTTLNFRTVQSSGGTLSVVTDGNVVNIETAGGTGEANTAQNVGGGTGEIFRDKTGVTINLKTITSTGGTVTIINDTDTINLESSGASSRIVSSATTTNTTATELEKIDTITDNTTSIIKVYVKAYQSGGSQWGVWTRTLTVTKTSGTVTVQEVNADVDKTSIGLKANDVTFTVNGGDIDIDVTGIAATTITWNSAYEIIL